MKKVILTAIVLGAFSVFVAGILFSGYLNSITGNVVSNNGEGLIVDVELMDFDINTTDGSVENIQNLKVSNPGSEAIFIFNMNVTKTPEDPTCPYENDCSVLFSYANNDLISEGDSVIIYEGQNGFWLTTSCVQFSCLQEISIDLKLSPLN